LRATAQVTRLTDVPYEIFGPDNASLNEFQRAPDGSGRVMETG
jgi:hypothetical protein